MEIVTCFDHGFVMPTGVMIYSLCKNNTDTKINFHLLVDKTVTEEDKNDLRQTVSDFMGECLFYSVDNCLFDDLPSSESRYDFTSAIYYRLLVAEILPKAIDKVLYLDGDLIVRQSLLPLWETDISEFAVAAVYERPYQMTDSVFFDFDRLGYSPQLGYFNSGVMLINLDFWRRNQITKKLFGLLNDYPEKLVLGDQDCLNIVLKENKLELPPKYNLISSFLHAESFDKTQSEEEVRIGIENPVIAHFTTDKPWYKYVRDSHPYGSTFIKYQDETIWKGQRVDRRPIKRKLRNAVADIMRSLKLKPKLEPIYINIKPLD